VRARHPVTRHPRQPAGVVDVQPPQQLTGAGGGIDQVGPLQQRTGLGECGHRQPVPGGHHLVVARRAWPLLPRLHQPRA
jgi:hypothetical protein